MKASRLAARKLLLAITLLFDVLAAASAGAAQAGADLPEGFVYLRDVAPSIQQDMRYATPGNFTGKAVPGYEAAECILKKDAALALKRAQEQAEAEGFSLKVYDCYRPVRAVRAFNLWAAAPEDGRTKHYYPRLKKSQLVPGYIAAQSGHSTGGAVDITLVPAQSSAPAPSSKEGDCTAPKGERAADNSLDMGTAFDCFDTKSNTASPLVTQDQRKSRMLLKGIMEATGFKNYAGEWWHFSYGGAGNSRVHDFVIRPHPAK
jgi:D-alanyl-D-alanine dipeptidase